MNKTRALLIRIAAVLVLVAVAALMMRIGRGHTVYLDNKTLEYNGETYNAFYKVVVVVKGEQVAKLYKRERGAATNIGQNFEMTLQITEQKNGEETTSDYELKLPYDLDGVVINIPGYLAGLPEEAYLSEFVPLGTEAATEEETIPDIEGFDMDMGDF